jgi:hypothetical protein
MKDKRQRRLARYDRASDVPLPIPCHPDTACSDGERRSELSVANSDLHARAPAGGELGLPARSRSPPLRSSDEAAGRMVAPGPPHTRKGHWPMWPNAKTQ